MEVTSAEIVPVQPSAGAVRSRVLTSIFATIHDSIK